MLNSANRNTKSKVNTLLIKIKRKKKGTSDSEIKNDGRNYRRPKQDAIFSDRHALDPRKESIRSQIREITRRRAADRRRRRRIPSGMERRGWEEQSQTQGEQAEERPRASANSLVW